MPMCDAYYDEPVEVWHETTHRARKEHRCWGCREMISPGATYQRTAIVFDGEAYARKHCMRCAKLLAALRERDPEAFNTDTLDLNCGEVWTDPPEDVAALAFALPGDFAA
jgi:hypothetical protein